MLINSICRTSKNLECYCLLCALFICPLDLTDFVYKDMYFCVRELFLCFIRKLITMSFAIAIAVRGP